METVADLIHEAITHRDDDEKLAQVREKVTALNAKFPLP